MAKKTVKVITDVQVDRCSKGSLLELDEEIAEQFAAAGLVEIIAINDPKPKNKEEIKE